MYNKNKLQALMQLVGDNEAYNYTNNDLEDEGAEFEHEGKEYFVLTDEEADLAFSNTLDEMVDEFGYDQIDEALRDYFDGEAMKSDLELDGRGHHLAHYDGEENEEEFDGVTYYIYRTN